MHIYRRRRISPFILYHKIRFRNKKRKNHIFRNPDPRGRRETCKDFDPVPARKTGTPLCFIAVKKERLEFLFFFVRTPHFGRSGVSRHNTVGRLMVISAY